MKLCQSFITLAKLIINYLQVFKKEMYLLEMFQKKLKRHFFES